MFKKNITRAAHMHLRPHKAKNTHVNLFMHVWSVHHVWIQLKEIWDMSLVSFSSALSPLGVYRWQGHRLAKGAACFINAGIPEGNVGDQTVL